MSNSVELLSDCLPPFLPPNPQEGVVMATMDHENVVRLYCVCMGQELMLVSQFVPLGSLLSFLKKYKDSLNAHTMLNFSVQIAKVCV